MFSIFPESWDYSTVTQRRSLHRSNTYSEWIAITPLIPMSSYVIQVNASNSVGYILSNVQTVDLEPGCKYHLGCHFTIYSLFMDIHNSFMDILN